MKDVLVYILQNITLEPDKIAVEEKTVDSQIDFYVTCATDDIGRIIGKKGKIIKAIRRVLGIMAVKEGKRVNITMVNPPATPKLEQDEPENEKA